MRQKHSGTPSRPGGAGPGRAQRLRARTASSRRAGRRKRRRGFWLSRHRRLPQARTEAESKMAAAPPPPAGWRGRESPDHAPSRVTAVTTRKRFFPFTRLTFFDLGIQTARGVLFPGLLVAARGSSTDRRPTTPKSPCFRGRHWPAAEKREAGSLHCRARRARMEEKLTKVTSWLKNIFGDQPIPPFEVNTGTVDILYKLAECNEARDRDVNLLIEDMKQKAMEYESDGRYLQELLMESLNLSLSSLSQDSTSCLNNLVDIALILETKDTSLASFIPAINDLTSDLSRAQSKNKELELELSTLRRKLTSALVLEKRLQDDVEKTEKFLIQERKTADRRKQTMKFLMKKSEDIKCEIKSAKDQLSASGLDASLTHESLVTLSQKLADVKTQSIPLKKKIESYLDLTPNPSLARVKIEEAKRELEALEAELSMKLDKAALSVTLPTKRPFV